MDIDALAAAIEQQVSAPRFRDVTLMITEVGAVGDGRTDCTAAIRAAIGRLAAGGGGRVIVPPGRFRTGAIQLFDGIELHLQTGAVLEFSRDPEDYLPTVFTRYEGVECYNFSPFVYAHARTDIGLTGDGVLDGRADAEHWWNWSRGRAGEDSPKRELLAAAAAGVPVEERRFGDRAPLRPGFVQFVDCRNVLISGLTFRNSPMWVLHPVLCRNVTIRDVVVDSHGPNNDGCNPESCRDVLITGCTFDTGDDCIAIKSGKDDDGRRVGVPSRNILISDCTMRAGHGGITIGSETSGDVTDVVGRRCRMDSPELKRALRIKSNADRGGVISRIGFSDIAVGQVAGPVIEIALDYGRVENGPFPPQVSDLTFLRVSADRYREAVRIVGLAEAPVRDVRLIDCDLEVSPSGDGIVHAIGLQQQRVPQR